MVRLTLLEKKFVFQLEISTYSPILFSKKSCEDLSGQRVVQSKPKWYSRLPVTFKLNCKKNGPPKFPRKKFIFQS